MRERHRVHNDNDTSTAARRPPLAGAERCEVKKVRYSLAGRIFGAPPENKLESIGAHGGPHTYMRSSKFQREIESLMQRGMARHAC